MRSASRWWLLLAVGLGVCLALAVCAQAQTSGILEGQVVNGTAGGPEVGAGMTVTLHLFQGDAEIDSLEATTDAAGRFRFEGLASDSELEYWLEVLYLGVPYGNPEPYRFAEGQTSLQTTVTVYETTDDEGAITLDSVHMIAESFGSVLRISEIHLFGNSGDRTYVGRSDDTGRLTTVRIPLPAGAVGLALQQDIPAERFVEVEGGLADTEPVPPGKEGSVVFFSYHLMAAGEAIPLERRFAYPVRSLSLLVAEPGLALRSDQLEAQGPQVFEGRQYQFYSLQGLGAGAPLTAELLQTAEGAGSGIMPTAPAGGEQAVVEAPVEGNQGLLRWFGVGLAALAVAGALLYPNLSRRPAAAPATGPALAANPRARRLLAELADLEAAFEAGEMDQLTYERQRADRYKAIRSL